MLPANNGLTGVVCEQCKNRDAYMDPCLHIYWRSASPSTIHASWKWSVPDTWEDMSGLTAASVLEHFADWR